MQQYNPREAAQKNGPEQQIIRAARNVEYDRQFKRSAEDKLNQENPTPQVCLEYKVKLLLER
jgi:hypothetical protein